MNDDLERYLPFLAAYARDELPAESALIGMLSRGVGLDRLRLDLGRLARPRQLHADSAASLLALMEENRAGLRAAAAMLASPLDDPRADPTLAAGLERCRRLFDWAVTLSPASSVALYSLGDEIRLAAATAEIAALLERLEVVAPDRRVLDVGCGIGRLEAALAGKVGSITGLELSAGMLAEARRRCTGRPDVHLVQGSGRDLACFADAAFDAALAIDVCPYWYRAGGPEFALAQLGELHRVLRPGGAIMALNLSYRAELARDRADAAHFAATHGCALVRNGTADVRRWDGLTFHVRKPA